MTETWEPIIAANETTGPLSAGQRSLWFLDRWAPGSATYNIPWAVRLRGPVDERAIEEALHVIATRHEALRTVFSAAMGEPRQIVRAEAAVPFAVRDFRGEPDAHDRTADHVRRVAVEPFDLERGPLLRASLTRTTDDGATLVVVFHHIVFDELSTVVFEREFTELYTAATSGRRPEKAPPALQYLDFSLRQRDKITGAAGEDKLDYWKRRLDGAPPVLSLPADRPRPSMRTFTGATATSAVPAETAARVRGLAEAEGVTTYMVLLAAFAALLHRDTGQDEFVVGTPVAGRDRIEWEGLIGYFVNMLPLRADAGGNPAFRDLLHGLRDSVLDDFDHQDVPFEAIVDRVVTDRPANFSPLVQVVFGMHDGRGSRELALGEATGTRIPLDTGTAKFDLIWSVSDDGARLGLEVEYDTDLFDAGTIARMAERWLVLLDAVTTAPETPIRTPSLLTAADRAVVLPATPRAVEESAPLHERFELMAARFPGRTAVSHETGSLSYAELNAIANRVAHWLLSRDVRPGDRVGLLLEDVPTQIQAILGVLKAGAAYVPVNPADPADRAELVFGDSEVRLVLTGDDMATATASFGGGGNPRVAGSADDVAYVIYTSGSTGRPKGVEVAHRNVTALFDAASPQFGISADDVWTVFHSYAFDFSVWEIWGALLHGGRIVAVPFATSRTPAEFAKLLVDERVTMLSQTPSALAQLTAALSESPMPMEDLRWVILGGEALRPQQVGNWFKHAKAAQARLCNMYGITETTVHVTSHDITDAEAFTSSVIGRPLPHLTVAVLDDLGRFTPIGVPGEMFVGGAGVANGYVGNPGLTAQRFVRGPVAGDDSRWYRTGDLARWRADGTLEYLGRSDEQVKIRGFRIELGEIQQVLSRHPAVSGCVVAAHTDAASSHQYLVAYAATGAASVENSELRAWLVSRLPGHMLPAVIVQLDGLPLTTNGKVDLKALPEPHAEAGRVVHDPPRTAGERLLAQVWQDVLHVDQVGRQDNFFELGGDSIRSVEVTGLLKKQGFELRLEALFASPVLADLAPALRRTGPGDGTASSAAFDLVPAEDRAHLPAGLVDAYPMTSMQLAMVYHMELDPVRRPYQNVNSYRMSGALDERALAAALTDVTRRHPVLRTTFDLVSFSRPMQLVHEDAVVEFRVEDLRSAPESEQYTKVTELVEREWAVPFDLGRAPLLRVFVQRLSEDTYQFTLVEHHAILDGWSFTSLFAEILDRHATLRDEPESPAPPPPASRFRDYVALEIATKESEESQAFWAGRMSGVRGTALTRGAETEGRRSDTGVLERELPEASARALREFAALNGVGTKSAALAAHVWAVGRLAGTNEVVTGLTVNGRLEDGAGIDAKGVFLNTVPIRAVLGGDWASLVRQLHRQESDLMPHRRMPYSELARHMGDSTLDCSFTFNRFHALGGLSTSRVEIVDDRLGVEPTIRREPNHFPLNVAFVQDPGSDRSLLIVDCGTNSLSVKQIHRYAADFAEAVESMARAAGTAKPKHENERLS